jgi:outer membrane protein insertion porin family
VDSLLLKGNKQVSGKIIQSLMKTRQTGIFVQQMLDEDIENITNYYHTLGLKDVQIHYSISPGENKSILIEINEGPIYQMDQVVVLGASSEQKNLLLKMFPLIQKSEYNQLKLESFKTDIENSAIFTDFKMVEIVKAPARVTVLILANPDRSFTYGFGAGWEEPIKKTVLRHFYKGLRGTLELQVQNVFASYSTLAALFQLGLDESRYAVSFNTPFFFKTKLQSYLKAWRENEIYPGYKFDRTGAAESIVSRIDQFSFVQISLNWYKTVITELEISETIIDRLNVPFDTFALSLSYAADKRDDPFHPSTGNFFSGEIKGGVLPALNNRLFFRIFLGYQKNYRLLRQGTLSVSFRNGFASEVISMTERFFAGGIQSFRGIANYSLGPVDQLYGLACGGSAMFIMNIEASFPFNITPIRELYYAVFFDLGNIYPTLRDFDLFDLETAVGISLKYKTPGPFARIDFAWNLSRSAGKNFKIHIGIGNVF